MSEPARATPTPTPTPTPTERETAARSLLAAHVLDAISSTTPAVQAMPFGPLRDKLRQAQQLLVEVHNELHGLSTSH